MLPMSWATRGRMAFALVRLICWKVGLRHWSGSSHWNTQDWPLLVPSSSAVTSVEEASPTIGTNLPGSSSRGGT